MNRRKRWMAHLGIPALLPEDPNGPDATSGGGGQPDPEPQTTSPELGDAGKKALSEERAKARAAEKRAADAEARLKALDEEKLSEQEKASKRAQEAEERATAAEARALRLEAAVEAGLPAAMAGRLQGSTKEDLLADAESLKSLLAPVNGTNGDGQGGTEPPPNGTNRRIPKPDPSQGGGKPTDGRSVAAGAALFAERKKQQVSPFTT